MKKSAAAVALGALALASASVGGATSARTVALKLDDAFTVRGTSLVCPYTRGKKFGGKRAIGCIKLADSDAAAVGSYAAAIGEDGTVIVVRWDTKTASKTVFRRKVAAAAAPSAIHPGKVGDSFAAAGTDLGCVITSSGGKPLASCFEYDGKGPRPNSYGVAANDAAAIVLKFDARGNPKVVYSTKQGR